MRGPISFFLACGLAAHAVSAGILFRLTRGLILVDAKIQGCTQPLHFIVDSGAGESLPSRTSWASN